MSNLDKKDLFDADTSFFDLPIVWRTVGAFIGLFVAITGIILWNGSYTFDGSGSGFNFFVKEFGFPLGVLSLLIPIIALYAAQHRSVLTIKQIKEAQVQNTFANFYKHREEFINNYRYLISKHYRDIFVLTSPFKVYELLYPYNTPQELVIKFVATSTTNLTCEFLENLNKLHVSHGLNGEVADSNKRIETLLNLPKCYGLKFTEEFVSLFDTDENNLQLLTQKVHNLLIDLFEICQERNHNGDINHFLDIITEHLSEGEYNYLNEKIFQTIFFLKKSKT